jgi:membrane-bound lytic murein transglycosylase F
MSRLVRAACLAALIACDKPPPAQPVDAGAPKSSLPLGIATIKQRGVLRVLTRNNGQTYFVLRGRRMGFDYELVEKLAQRLGEELEVVVPTNWGDLLPMLQRGEGDLIAAAVTVTDERAKQVAFARPYALTHTRVVWAKGQQRIKNPEDLAGKTVHVRRFSAYYDILERLSAQFEAVGMPPVEIVIEGESLETEQLVVDAVGGKIPYTLCDYHICLENKHYLPNLVIGPVISEPRPLAWAVNREAPDLLEEVNAFFGELRKSGELQQVYSRYYQQPRSQAQRMKDEYNVDKSGRVSPFDDIFKRVGHARGVDWRLLASIAYQESRFDPKARHWHGGEGLFGMHLGTAKQLGAANLDDPENATDAAAQQLAAMRVKFSQIPDDGEQVKMAVAGYHDGTEHITDARILASQQNLNPDMWRDVAKVLPLLSKPEYAAKTQHGYVRGAETVTYVEEIWARYRAFRHATGERD